MTTWTKLVKALKRECPILNKRFVVKRVEMKDHGCTTLSDSEKTLTITIRKQDPLAVQIDSLIHEWGHAMDEDSWDSHGKTWGGYYSKAYKVLESFR